MRRRQRCEALPTMGELPVPRPVARTRRREPEAATVPLARIVASLARCCDFDRCFGLLRRELRPRLEAVRSRWPTGAFPAVRLARVGEHYAVVDGHHRIALAAELGMVAVDAEVTDLH